jgi:hypothetical protein
MPMADRPTCPGSRVGACAQPDCALLLLNEATGAILGARAKAGVTRSPLAISTAALVAPAPLWQTHANTFRYMAFLRVSGTRIQGR